MFYLCERELLFVFTEKSGRHVTCIVTFLFCLLFSNKFEESFCYIALQLD